jgi:hypothetical protein
MVLTFGSASVTTSIAASLVRDALRGRSVGMISSAACGFVFTGQYDPANYRLSGIYRAVNGCSGEKGTFSMKEQCYYVRDWDAVRRDGGPAHC